MPRAALLALAVLVLVHASLLAQQAGHATVPGSGAAARGGFPTAEREQDPVIVRIEELRKALADTTRQYKKLREAARAERQRELLAALARVETEVGEARAIVAER